MLNYEGNYIKINNEGIIIISSVYFDSYMKFQLNKLNNNIINNDINIEINNSFNSFDSFHSMQDDEESNIFNKKELKTSWKVMSFNKSYNKGKIIFLPEKSSLDLGFFLITLLKVITNFIYINILLI